MATPATISSQFGTNLNLHLRPTVHGLHQPGGHGILAIDSQFDWTSCVVTAATRAGVNRQSGDGRARLKAPSRSGTVRQQREPGGPRGSTSTRSPEWQGM